MKDYDTNFYIHVYEILLIKMYLISFKTNGNSVFHAINFIYLDNKAT